ncbi:CBS domain-containing protein, partial [Candidatus Marsarchaeota archaeon]|nr:CBS domain-containing protein [Candidatus Marsarchaeota archaeon]
MANSIDRIPKELVSRTEMLEADTPITRVLAVVQKNNAALVSKDGSYYGVVDMRSLSRGKGMRINKNAIALNYAVRVPKIFPTTTIDDAVFYFYNSKATALPYFEENKPVGIVNRYTLLKVLLSIDALSGIKCSDIMTTPVLGIDANANLAQANSVMSDRDIGRLIVIENGKLSGIITKHDISANYAVTKERAPEMKSKLYSPSNIIVRNIMEKSPITIGASDEVR